MLMSRRGMPRFIGHGHLDGRGALRPLADPRNYP